MFKGFSQNYFQQDVNFKINIRLNDVNKTLSGFEEVEYTNNANETLDFLYFHIWPNAYKNNETALAKQLYRMKNMALQYANEKARGYMDSLDFKVNNEQIKWEYDPTHIDIVKLYLKTPLKPGETISISTPFKVKIPSGDISRLGYVGESFQITQWYPKPAVYDLEGWHQIPYLTQGEFYAEFGSFDVSITLPKNYVVGATGDLQTASELDFLNDLAARTTQKFETNGFGNPKNKIRNSPFPPSDSTYKTIRYTQNNVHDFGWFADKRFEVLKGEVTLPHSKRKVTTWAMFVPHHAKLWEDAISYINDGTFYYSKWNGDYQYNQVTAVDGTISAGGGMEYPNVTVIGDASSKEQLEVVIVHEVGHNWFYGMLGSNERVHPWMDEGMNTLNELRYIETKYPNNTQLSDMMGGFADKIHLEHLNHHDMSDLTYAATASGGMDQPIELASDDYSSMNYGGIVYSKTGLVFTYLKEYLGEEVFDSAMQEYFRRWVFKHPQPKDLKNALEEVSGKNLSWLFDDIIPTTKQIDYKISKVKQEDDKTIVTIKNAGQINGPIKVEAYTYGKLRASQWLEPGDKKRKITFDEKGIDAVKIDANKRIPEVNRKNNYWQQKGLFGKLEPFELEFLAGDNEPDKTKIWISPMGAYNIYDNIMVGVVLHNYSLPKNKFEYIVAPMYSFGRTNIAGYMSLRYSFVPAQNFKMISIGIRGKNFGFSEEDKSSNYIAISPYIDFIIGKPKKRSNLAQNLKIQGVYNLEDGQEYNIITGGFAKYELNYKQKLHQFKFKLRTDYIAEMKEDISVMNAYVNGFYKFNYWEKKHKHISIGLNFSQNIFYNGTTSDRFGLALSGQNGTQDVFYESYMFARNVTSGVGVQRRINNQGSFNSVSGLTTKNQLITANIYLEIPYIPLIGVFSDFGMIPAANGMETFAQAGLGIQFLDGDIGVFIPLYENAALLNSHGISVDNVWKKVRFTLNLTNITPNKVMSNLF
ncbi:hypothetical protein DNU06_13155 [Putridiphycobacter roseus]|uniref:Peptidase M1 membrane alanine aminopeptidase domain-containing protein n=2 Tax=Putridiphycobacter roseus TaxID=2219161 RepID=A0A2W1NPE1_9FLAO|nr:hypothetical protein DNU06_13155 [Putridiphycobacter roseus]